jgi:hypothetical protein
LHHDKSLDFDEMIALIDDWKTATGNTDLRRLTAYFTKGTQFSQLGQWIDDKRKQYNNGDLTPQQIEKLREAGVTFISHYDHDWDLHFKQLLEYHAEHQFSFVIAKLPRDDPHIKVSDWFNKQREKLKCFALGEESTDDQTILYRIQRLNEAFPPNGFPWTSTKRRDEFDQKANKYAEWVHLYGPDVERKAKFPKYDDWKIGKWVSKTRIRLVKFLEGKGDPSEEDEYEIIRLNQIGFYWKTKRMKRQIDGMIKWMGVPVWSKYPEPGMYPPSQQKRIDEFMGK